MNSILAGKQPVKSSANKLSIEQLNNERVGRLARYAAIQPTAAVTGSVRHRFLQRAGFGPAWGQIEEAEAQGFSAYLEQQLDHQNINDKEADKAFKEFKLYSQPGAATGRVTVVVMSEFGRQLKENPSLGTDHGHGGFMRVMGDHVSQSRVFINAGWQAITDLNAAGEIDLPLLTDYRDVLGEILRRRMNNANIAQVFPNYTVTERGLVT